MQYIAYYRVSTQRQGRSGLGLEAQQKTVKDQIGEPIAAYVEVETGKSDDRPELQKALAHAKGVGATLVVAKLDRLARNLRFLLEIMDSGVEVIFCDMPHANRFTLSILGAVAEYEAKLISDRTKAALAAARARGVSLGGYRARRADGSPRRDASPLRDQSLVRQVSQLRRDGLGLTAIAKRLSEQGITSPKGGVLTATHIKRILAA